MNERRNDRHDHRPEEYFEVLGSEFSAYAELLSETQTLAAFASRYGGGEDLLVAAEQTDDALREPATATVGYADAAAAAGIDDQFLTLDREDDPPTIRFEADLQTLKSRAGPSWPLALKKSPTTVTDGRVSFKVYAGVPEEGAEPIEAEHLTHLRLQLPPISRMRYVHGKERYVVQSRLQSVEWSARSGGGADGEEATRVLSAIDDVLRSMRH